MFQVTFEEVEGFVSSQYLVLSYNGEFVEIDEILTEISTVDESDDEG